MEQLNELAVMTWIHDDNVKVHIDYAPHHHPVQAKTQAIMSAEGAVLGG